MRLPAWIGDPGWEFFILLKEKTVFSRAKDLLSERYSLYIFLLPAIILLLMVGVFPFGFNVYLSLNKFQPGSIHSEGFSGLTNFWKAISNKEFLNSFRITLFYMITCVVIELVLGLALALLLNRNLKGKSIIRTFLLLPMMIAPAVAAYIFIYLYNPFIGVVGYYLRIHRAILGSDLALSGIMFVDVWQWTPFMMLISLAALQSLPAAPFEAARIDGASGWQTLRYITLPLIKPIVLIGILLRMIDAYKVFAYVAIMTEGGPGCSTRILSYHGYDVMFTNLQWGQGGALSLIILFTIILICTVYMKVLKVSI